MEAKESVPSEERTKKYVQPDTIFIVNMEPLSVCSRNTIFLTCYIFQALLELNCY